MKHQLINYSQREFPYAVYFNYNVVSQSGDNGGTTTIEWSLTHEYTFPSSSYTMSWNTEYLINIDGQTYSGTKSYDFADYYSYVATLASGVSTLTHNYNGTITPNVSVESTTTHITTSEVKNMERTITLSLPTLKIASRIECPASNIGTTPTITIVKQSASHTNTLYYDFGSQSATIVEKTSATSYAFPLPMSFYAEIPNARYGVGILMCDTYDGDELIGTNYTTFTANVNEASSTPTIFPTIKDTNAATIALTGDSNKFVRFMSIASVDIGAEARNYATIKSQICANGSKAITTATGTINGVEQAKFACSATDSRGFTTTINMTKPFVEYIRLTCNIGENLPDTSGEMVVTCSGSYWAGNFGAVSNTLTVEYRYKESGGSYSAWRAMSASAYDTSYTATATLSGLDYTKQYVFQCRATDKLLTANSSEQSARTLPVFHWSESDFVFEVPVTFKQGASGVEGGGGGIVDGTIDSDVRITGDLRLKSDYDYGNTLYFGDGSYCYLQENTDDDLTIKASDLNLNVSNLYLNGGAIKAGTWTPTLTTSAAVSSYSTRSGWYVRVGNVVTIGFNIAATCNSGYNSTSLAISGLPFTPANNAFGGGVMFGAYVNAGFCFEAWAASTNGQITPRLQPCNNTTAGNLQIASTAYYPSGANSVTLGGTITYLIS